ncbi:MAG: winged helix-turn-helix domain-containing protein [Elusimicrobia bacterium]|nr:winged helix-turn-helix domain-containing protein [Elusimicrobiota bacterium]
MWIPVVGENAGKVWQVLHTKGQSNLDELKNGTSLDDKNLYMALGWLAKEGKVKIEQKQKQIAVSLI